VGLSMRRPNAAVIPDSMTTNPSYSAQRKPHYLDRTTRRSVAPEAPLFSYGTLQFDEVLTALLGRVPSRSPARAVGWKAVRLPNVTYPGLVAASATAPGVTISGLTETEWRVIDAFEDSFYGLDLVELADGTRAWAYTCSDDVPHLDTPWDAAEFAPLHLAAFVEHCTAWRRRYEAEDRQ